jgi:hypothetical protein
LNRTFTAQLWGGKKRIPDALLPAEEYLDMFAESDSSGDLGHSDSDEELVEDFCFLIRFQHHLFWFHPMVCLVVST